MTTFDGQSVLGTDAHGVEPQRVEAQQATALDASIDREIRRGRSQGELSVKLRSILDVIVSHETERSAPLNAASLSVIAPVAGAMAAFRHDRRVNTLIRLGLLRRDKLTIRPTVAGVGTVRPTERDLARVPRDLLRELRRGEIGVL